MTNSGHSKRMSAQRGMERRRVDFSFRATSCGGVTVEMGNKTMRSGTIVKPTKSVKPSVTDRILTFCASGRFGVREAIAAVTTPRSKVKRQPAEQQDLQEMG